MGVQYDGATQFHQGGFKSVVDPIIMSCWFKLDALPVAQATLMCRGASGNYQRYFAMYIDNTGALYAEVSTTPGPSIGQAITANTCSTGVWNHALVWFETAVNRGAILNGGTEATNATAVAPIANELWIGARRNTGAGSPPPSRYHTDGTIAHACAWEAPGTVVDFLAMQPFAAALYAGRPAHSYWSEYIMAYYPMHDPGAASVLSAWYTSIVPTTTSPLSGVGSPTQGEMPILAEPWRRNTHQPKFRPRVQVIGRTRIIGSTQLAVGA